MIATVKPWTFFTYGLLVLICVGIGSIGFDQIRLKSGELEIEKRRSAALKAEISLLRKQNAEFKQVVKGWNDMIHEIVDKEQSDRERIVAPRSVESNGKIW